MLKTHGVGCEKELLIDLSVWVSRPQGQTVNLLNVQKTINSPLHKKAKPHKVIAKPAGSSQRLSPNIATKCGERSCTCRKD